jgi:hypothetical protein
MRQLVAKILRLTYICLTALKHILVSVTTVPVFHMIKLLTSIPPTLKVLRPHLMNLLVRWVLVLSLLLVTLTTLP